MNEFSTFKTALVGGFDKDDVMVQLKSIKDEAKKEVEEIKKRLAEKEATITELQEKVRSKEEEVELLKEDIKEKYKKYEENYNSISKLVFDAQIKADRMRNEAQEQCEQMLDNAKEEAQKMLEEVEKEVDVKLEDGKKKYKDVQAEIREIAKLMSQVQSKFMASYRDINDIIEGMPEDFQEIEVEDEFSKLDAYDNYAYNPSDIPMPELAPYQEEIALSSEFDEFDALDEAQKEIELQLQQFLEDDELDD